MFEQTHTSMAAHLMLRAAERLGINRQEIFQRAGLTEGEVPMGPLPMSWSALKRLTRAMTEACPQGQLPFRAALDMSVYEMGIVGAYEVQAASFRESRHILYNLALPRYSTMARMWLEEEDDWGRICAGLTPAGQSEAGDMAPQLHLFLGLHIKGLREFFGVETPIERLCLTATQGVDAAALAAYLKVPVLLGQPLDCVVVRREIFDHARRIS